MPDFRGFRGFKNLCFLGLLPFGHRRRCSAWPSTTKGTCRRRCARGTRLWSSCHCRRHWCGRRVVGDTVKPKGAGQCQGTASTTVGGRRREVNADSPHRKTPSMQTRLLTRLLQEVWFPGHACHAFLASLFASLFAGKREVARSSAGFGAPCCDVGN